MSHQPEPTVVGVPNFDAAEDAAALRAAMKGAGTDEQAIIDILTSRSNEQRQAIAQAYAQEYGKDIIEDLKSELGGNFEEVIVALMHPPAVYLCKELNHAITGVGTDEQTLIEIICTRSKKEIAELVEEYEKLYNRPLAEHLCSDTTGEIRRLLTLIVTSSNQAAHRDEEVDEARAARAAQELHDAGEGMWGTDEGTFSRILAHESFPQLRATFEAYKAIAGRSIEQAIHSEVSGDLKHAYSAVVECAQNTPAWMAMRLRAAVEGAGTDANALIRIITTRAEVDLGNIKKEYERIFNRTLESDTKSDTSGDHHRALAGLLGPA